jgi:hypothetical protein
MFFGGRCRHLDRRAALLAFAAPAGRLILDNVALAALAAELDHASIPQDLGARTG